MNLHNLNNMEHLTIQRNLAIAHPHHQYIVFPNRTYILRRNDQIVSYSPEEQNWPPIDQSTWNYWLNYTTENNP